MLAQSLQIKFKKTGYSSDYMSGNFSKSMGIIDTNSDEIIRTVNLLKSSFSKGADDISSVVTKKVINELSLPLSIIFNKSFQLGQFLDKLKITKIIPIFKSEDKVLIHNYRPISILLFFSKILERLMYSRLLNYLTLNNILVENQFGFRQGHSTYMALKLVNDITEELDKGNCSIGIFIDLSKAFDTVDHKLLLRKNRALWYKRQCTALVH